MIDVEKTAKGIRWNIVALATVLPIVFIILIWQLWGLTPERYCDIVSKDGVPPGDHCFKTIIEIVHIKGITIYALIALVAVFTVISLVAAVKAVVSLVGPGNLKLDVRTSDDREA